MKTEIVPMMIKEIIEAKKENVLRVNEEYQRGSVWGKKQKALLIDSILRGYPIPLFYIHASSKEAARWGGTVPEIIDGQQRINAIYEFFKGEYPLMDPKKAGSGIPRYLAEKPCPWANKRYIEFDQELKDQFLETKIQVAEVKTDDDNEARDLFVRLQAGMPLNPQEKRDAWPGQFSKYIIDIAGKKGVAPGHELFNSKKLYGGTGKRGGPRMRQTCAQIFMNLYTRLDAKDPDKFIDISSKQIDEFYRHHLDFDVNAPESYANRFKRVLDVTTHILSDRKIPPLKMHSAFHTILLVDDLIDDFVPDWKDRFAKALTRFLGEVSKASAGRGDLSSEYYREYGAWTGTRASDKRTLARRHRFFTKKMVGFLAPLKRKDPKRAFSREERELLYYSSDYTCAICKQAVDWFDAEAHHAKPHSKGGITTLDNAELVHKQCHPRGYSSYTKSLSDDKPSEPLWDIGDIKEDKPLKAGASKRIRLSDLYNEGLLNDGDLLFFETKSGLHEAHFKAPNSLVYKLDGIEFKSTSPSKALGQLVGYSVNGWKSWIVEGGQGKQNSLDSLREEYRNKLEKALNGEDEEELDED